MARAIIGTGSNGYGSAPKIRLDDDCGAKGACGCGTGPGDGTGGGDDSVIGVLPVLQIVLRQRVGYTDDGVPMFDWVPLSEGPAFAYEERTEWDAEAGATVIKAKMVIPNVRNIDMVPETAMVRERSSDTVWEITATAVFPDRIAVEAYRVWREVPGPGPVFDV